MPNEIKNRSSVESAGAAGETLTGGSAADPAHQAELPPVARPRRPRRRTLVLLAAALALIIGGVVAWTGAFRGSPSPSVSVVQASDRFPSQTPEDWVSYSDQVDVFSVVGEEEIPLSAEEVARGEGYVERAVTLRLEKMIWSRKQAAPLEATVRIYALGWVLRESKRVPVAVWGGPRLEVGQRYILPLVWAPEDDANWTPLSIGATLPLSENGITTAGVYGEPSPIARAWTGKSVDEVAAVLAQTPPDPIAAKYAHLEVTSRQVVCEAERAILA